MSGNNRPDNSWVPVAIGGVAAFVAFLIWQFSYLLNLDFGTGSKVFFGMLGVTALFAASWWFGHDNGIIGLWNIWWILLGLVWCCWWPALNYWGATRTGIGPLQGLSYDQSSEGFAETVWWAAWYTKLGILAVILGIGYLAKKYWDDR